MSLEDLTRQAQCKGSYRKLASVDALRLSASQNCEIVAANVRITTLSSTKSWLNSVNSEITGRGLFCEIPLTCFLLSPALGPGSLFQVFTNNTVKREREREEEELEVYLLQPST